MSNGPKAIQIPQKIIFIVSSGAITGGGQISLLELLKHLDRSRFHPIFAVGSEGTLSDRLRQLDIEVALVPMPAMRINNAIGIIQALIGLAKVLKIQKAQLIHSNDTRAHIYAGIIARIFCKPNIFHFRVSYSDGLFDLILPFLATKIVAVSSAAARRFKHFKTKTMVIHNGVDCQKFAPAQSVTKQCSLIPNANPVLGTIGRLEKAKGIDGFLKTIAALQMEFPHIGGLVVGNGPQKSELLTLSASLRIDKRIVFIDEYNDIPAFMQGLDIFMLLSDNEGLNRSIMEAMACGKCVVASRVGGNLELIPDESCGRLVAYNDGSAALNVVTELLQDKASLKSIGEAARRGIQKNFTIEQHAIKMEEVFTLLLK